MTTRKKAPPASEATKTEKILDNFARAQSGLAKSQATVLIGEIALEVLARDGDISLRALLDALQQRVDSAPSKRGDGTARMDIRLIQAEEAIAQLVAARPSS